MMLVHKGQVSPFWKDSWRDTDQPSTPMSLSHSLVGRYSTLRTLTPCNLLCYWKADGISIDQLFHNPYRDRTQ